MTSANDSKGEPMTDFDVWWTDQDYGNLDTKDLCRSQWVTMEANGLDCSAITQIMDNSWSLEFFKRKAGMSEMAALGQEFDKRSEDHAADMCKAVKAVVYSFAGKVPLATAIGVLDMAKLEIISEQN